MKIYFLISENYNFTFLITNHSRKPKVREFQSKKVHGFPHFCLKIKDSFVYALYMDVRKFIRSEIAFLSIYLPIELIS